MSEPTIIHPTQEQISEAHRLTDDLYEIATQESALRARNNRQSGFDALSQSDRLVIVAARLGRIRELLATRYVYPDLAKTAGAD
jgi:hypothetical protein